MAMKQGLVEPPLQGADLRAHGSRGHVQSVRPPGKAHVARYRFEGAQCIEWNIGHND